MKFWMSYDFQEKEIKHLTHKLQNTNYKWNSENMQVQNVNVFSFPFQQRSFVPN